MINFFNSKKEKKKKGFTLIELAVVVTILAILAVIATPQFLGTIDKSRVSGQIADLNGISKAVTMFNFDTSAFPVSVAGDEENPQKTGWITGSAVEDNILFANQDVDGDGAGTATVVGWSGPYMNSYPTNNRWGGGFEYTTGTAVADAGLTATNVAIKLTNIPADQAAAIERAVDDKNFNGTASDTGVVRIVSGTVAGVDPATVYYVIN